MAVEFTRQEEAVVRAALGIVLERLDGLPPKDEDTVFGIVVEALGEQMMLEGDVCQIVVNAREKLRTGAREA